jgi:PAS domain S-box-containing protein
MPDPAPDTDVSEQLRLLIDTQTEYAMFVLDPQGCIRSWNAGARRIKGYEPEDIIGQHFSVFYTEEDKARQYPQHELAVATETGRYEDEGWRIRKDGSRFWASVIITALRHQETGELVGFGKVTRDLTSRRLSEEQLRTTAMELATANEELEQFRMLVANVRDYAIFLLDAGGHVRTWNAGAQHIKGYTESEIIGRHFSTFYTQDDRARNHPGHELEIAAREGRYEEEGWRVRRDGTTFWANVVITALRNEHGILTGFAKVTRDLTSRRETELRLRRTAAELEVANTELQRFASVAAHDLAAPLQTLAGFADLLSRRYADALDDQGRKYLAHITAGSERMRRLIDGLLRYARSSQADVRLEPVSVAGALDVALENLRSAVDEHHAEIVFDPLALPRVMADADLLVNVLQNLVANALKFSGGRTPHVEISASREADVGPWRVEVADNGIGIPPEQQERIFTMFARVDPREDPTGVGIGLALTERLVARLGGQIGVDSVVGEGSRFWFTLPAANGSHTEPQPVG